MLGYIAVLLLIIGIVAAALASARDHKTEEPTRITFVDRKKAEAYKTRLREQGFISGSKRKINGDKVKVITSYWKHPIANNEIIVKEVYKTIRRRVK